MQPYSLGKCTTIVIYITSLPGSNSYILLSAPFRCGKGPDPRRGLSIL
jgi:hypothetical protein